MSNNNCTFTLFDTEGSYSFIPKQIEVNLNQPCSFAIVPGDTGATFQECHLTGIIGESPFSNTNTQPSKVTFTYDGGVISLESQVQIELVLEGPVVVTSNTPKGAIINS